MRGADECPNDDCEREPVRVEPRVIRGRSALVYWHREFKRYCIEYPDGETTSHKRPADKRRKTA